jgi:hypothetical protein
MLVAWRLAGLFALILDYAVEVARAQFQPTQSLLAIEGHAPQRQASRGNGRARYNKRRLHSALELSQARNVRGPAHPAGGQTSDIITVQPKGPLQFFV